MPWGIAAAAVGIGSSVAGGIMGQKGAKEQGRTTAAWTNSALNSINSAWGATQQTTRPFIEMGEKAGTTLTDLLLGKGNARQLLQSSDLFNFQSEIGSRNINRELVARGKYDSGEGLETLAMFNRGLVADEGQRLVDRLFNLTGLGAKMAGQQAQHYQDIAFAQGNAKLGAGTQISNAVGRQYQSMADMTTGIGNSIQGGIMQYGNYKMNQPLIEQSQRMTDAFMAKEYGMTSASDAALARKHGLY